MLKNHPLFEIPVFRSESAESIVDSFAGKRILVVGDLMLDEYLIGEVRRISPEAPVPVVDITHRAHVPGGRFERGGEYRQPRRSADFAGRGWPGRERRLP